MTLNLFTTELNTINYVDLRFWVEEEKYERVDRRIGNHWHSQDSLKWEWFTIVFLLGLNQFVLFCHVWVIFKFLFDTSKTAMGGNYLLFLKNFCCSGFFGLIIILVYHVFVNLELFCFYLLSWVGIIDYFKNVLLFWMFFD